MIEREIRNAFDGIHAEESLKQSTREYLAKRAAGLAGKRRRTRLAAAAVCCFLLLIGLGSSVWFTPVAAVSIDVNPSVGLSLNRFDRVISVTAYNPEGEEAVKESSLLFLSCTDAVDQLLNTPCLSSYLDQNQEVSVTVSGDNEEKSAELLQTIETHVTACGHHVSGYSASSETAHAAHHSGLSTGKYQAFLEWQALDPTVTQEDAAALSLQEIRRRIAALQNKETAQTEGTVSSESSTATPEGNAGSAGNQHRFGRENKGKHHGNHG